MRCRPIPSTRLLVSLLVLVASAGCSWMNRGAPSELFLGAFFNLGAPVISGGPFTDPEVNCAPGEIEIDKLGTWRTRVFTPSFEDRLDQTKISLCAEPGKKAHFVAGTPSTILQTGDSVGGSLVDQVFEYDQVGAFTLAAGSYQTSDNAVFVGQWNAGSVSWSRAFGTGTTFSDSSSINFFTGFDAGSDGSNLSVGFSYVDNLNRSGLGFCQRPLASGSWSCGRLLLASDLGEGEIGPPKIGLDCPGETTPGSGCANPAPHFISFYTASQQFLPYDSIYRIDVTPTIGSASKIVGIGDGVPGEAETFLSFGDHTSLASGNQWSAFAAMTSPSVKSGIWTFGSGGLSPAATFISGTRIPDSLEIATQVDYPSMDLDKVSFQVHAASGRSAYVTQADDGKGSFGLIGFARTGVDMHGDKELTTLYSSRSSVYDGTAILGLGLSSTAGSEIAIVAQDVSEVQVLAGGAAAMYGASATAGVVNVMTRVGSEGFDVAGPFGAGPDFQSSDFGPVDRLFLGTGNGDLYDWDFGMNTANFLAATGAPSLYSLAVDANGGIWGGSDTTFYSIDSQTYQAQSIGLFRDSLQNPITNIRGMSAVGQDIGAAGQDGSIYSVDKNTGVLTPQATIIGLPSLVESLTIDPVDERIWGGLQDGRLTEFIDWSAHANGGASVPLVANGGGVPSIGFGVVGDVDNGPITALAVMAPEPAAASLSLAALASAAALASLRQRKSG